jgi:adenine-specific DNA-methyltransferase
MGSKHDLSEEVAGLVAEFDVDRPFLDLFCGMCSIGGAVAPSGRKVWGNDIQWAANTAARCLLATVESPLDRDRISAVLREDYETNASVLSRRFRRALAEERLILESGDRSRFTSTYDGWRHGGNDRRRAAEVARLAEKPHESPYRLFTLTFAWGYFGLKQAIAIDSVRYAIDSARERRALSAGEARWALLALMQACSCVASTPGHFAQYLNGRTPTSFARVAAQRKRDVWGQFLSEVVVMAPYGDAAWRHRNRVFRQDALTIWPRLRRLGFERGVVYADPPYSKDHYSRFYHVLETLIRYDYPPAMGAGRYRPDRFVTPFSLKTKVLAAFEALFAGVAATESALILSYPSNGLLSPREIEHALDRHFGSADLALCRRTTHSTLGGRHGNAANRVHEMVFVAQPTA